MSLYIRICQFDLVWFGTLRPFYLCVSKHDKCHNLQKSLSNLEKYSSSNSTTSSSENSGGGGRDSLRKAIKATNSKKKKKNAVFKIFVPTFGFMCILACWIDCCYSLYNSIKLSQFLWVFDGQLRNCVDDLIHIFKKKTFVTGCSFLLETFWNKSNFPLQERNFQFKFFVQKLRLICSWTVESFDDTREDVTLLNQNIKQS